MQTEDQKGSSDKTKAMEIDVEHNENEEGGPNSLSLNS